MTKSLDIAVIGAGIVGIATAGWLQREGHRITIIDPAPPGQGASFGNAGCFSPSSILPMAGPGMLRAIPGWLLDPEGPLALRWRYLPVIAPWLIRFVRAATPAGIAHQAAALSRLLAPVHDSLAPLLRDAGAEGLVRRDGSLIVYRSAAGWAASQDGWATRARHGIAWEELDPGALRDLDPSLVTGLHRGVKLPGNGHSIDPHALVVRLAEAFLRNGGRLHQAAATGFELTDGRLRAVRTGQGDVLADRAVLAAGAHSAPLAGQLGDRVPLETERGYHLDLPAARPLPALPTVFAEDRFVATPMTGGLRLTGTVELAGLTAPPDWRRARNLLALARRLYPALAEAEVEAGARVWMGHRPSLPDSLPIIGFARDTPDVVYAFGHGHLGLTGAPFTGRLVADLVSGRPPAIDLADFAPSRFCQ